MIPVPSQTCTCIMEKEPELHVALLTGIMYFGRHNDAESSNGVVVAIEKASLQGEVAGSSATATETGATTIN